MTLRENRLQLNNGMMLAYDLQFFADGPGGEKTEQPTAKKLQDARNEGQVAKSVEVGHAAGLMSLFVLIRVLYPYLADNFTGFFRNVYTQIPTTAKMYEGAVPFASLRITIMNALIRILLTAAPFLAVALVVQFICNLVQVKWKITTKPLKPKLSKLNPIKGFKKIFSTRKLFELIKSIAKIGVIGSVVYVYFLGYTASIFTLYDMPLKQAIGLLGNTIVELGIRIAAVYGVSEQGDTSGVMQGVGGESTGAEGDADGTGSEGEDNQAGSESDSDSKGANAEDAQEAAEAEQLKASESLAAEIKESLDVMEVSNQIDVNFTSQFVQLTLQGAILFDTGNATLKPGADVILNKVGSVLERYAGGTIEIEGHTDNVPMHRSYGKITNNDELSDARALSVFYYLVDNTTLEPAKLKHSGRGEYEPVADNSTPEGRARNRRVEIRIYNPLSPMY